MSQQLHQEAKQSPGTEKRARVLVTGGTGLVGTALREIVAQDPSAAKYTFYFVSSKDCDLRDPQQTRCLFARYRPIDYIIHLAARVGGLYANMCQNDQFYSENKAINENVLENAAASGVRKCISCLSTCIFPAQVEYPLDETKIHLGAPHHSNRGYSEAKREIDVMNCLMNAKHGRKSIFTSVIPTNVYGKFDNFNLADSHVVPALIHKIYLSAIEARNRNESRCSVEVLGTGKALRQFIYAPDLAKLIVWVLESYDDSAPIILSPDESDELSISEVVLAIGRAFEARLGVSVCIHFNPDQSDGQLKKTSSNAKLRKLYPEFKFTPFSTGIEQVVEWFCANYDKPGVRL